MKTLVGRRDSVGEKGEGRKREEMGVEERKRGGRERRRGEVEKNRGDREERCAW
jgi:hypothetical protein